MNRKHGKVHGQVKSESPVHLKTITPTETNPEDFKASIQKIATILKNGASVSRK